MTVQRRDVGNGWYVEYDSCSTLTSQQLVYDRPGSACLHHTGQRAVYLINGAAKRVAYSCGDSYRIPSKFIVGCASEALHQLNAEGALFTMSQKGYESLFVCSYCDKPLTKDDEDYGTDGGCCPECSIEDDEDN